MKFPIISTIVVAACALAATAQADLKVASVNVRELYLMFHKRFNVESLLQEQRASIATEFKAREDKLRALQEELKKVHASYDPSLSEAATKKLRDEITARQNELQAANIEYQKFKERRDRAFGEMYRREMIALLQEVQSTITDVTGKGGYDLVIDSGAVSAQHGTPVFPYVKSTFDITPEVLKQLNAGAPEGFDPKAELERLYGQPQQGQPAPKADQAQ